MKNMFILIVLLLFPTFIYSQSFQKKPNDILVAVINNPNASAYDFASQLQLYKSNTQLLPYSTYIKSSYIKKNFNLNGSIDQKRLIKVYNRASSIYTQLPINKEDFDKKYSDEMEYSPFDLTRPKGAKTFDVN